MKPMDDATRRQVQAADPRQSTWLSANAGSGKTRVLTDRVARLLLDGVQPQNILCLTYTKAAASEMQNRLFARLGSWSMKHDPELIEELAGLGVDGLDDPERLASARRLFARAIETPGGLRIQTIHSFCAALLRRFPLEAGVTPNFTEIDERGAALLRDAVLERIAARDPGVIDAVADHLSGDDIAGLTDAILSNRAGFEAPAKPAEILHWFGVPDGQTEAAILADVFLGDEPRWVPRVLQALDQSDKPTDGKLAEKLRSIDWQTPGPADMRVLFGALLTGPGAKSPFSAKIGTIPTKDVRQGLGPDIESLNALMIRVEDARQPLLRIWAAQKTQALHRFAHAFLAEYEAEKRRRGWLDFDDLILKTRSLLADDRVAAWVLYRLDGGLDHILVDEAQDTSPTQWQVIEALAQEFTSGLGARDDVLRTIFVVGDKKQSIYSFQGADPAEFDRMEEHFRQKLQAIQVGLQSMALEFSFRSSPAILEFVDQAVAISGMRHRAFRAEMPGRVDLWPAVPPAEKPEKRAWYDPVDILAENDHSTVLARKISGFLRDIVGKETIPLNDGKRRLVRAGDILILVRKRSELFHEIIREMKAVGLPVAGSDRLKLGGELAVRDLSALLSFLATPEDDLSLAAVLRSPLFGWDEAALFGLAARRGDKRLWQELRGRRNEFGETLAVLDDLREAADFLRPYDLLERVLTRHDGRRKLLARLGQEAEDGIDALLSQSLSYERTEVPSLTGFVTWMQTEEVEIKRQLDNAGDLIRVMTVHGAKGLEAPIVILPDTAKRKMAGSGEVLKLAGGRPAWRVNKDEQPDILQEAAQRADSARAEEEERLFYVAATRAETWLIVAGAGDTGDDSWYARAAGAMDRLGGLPLAAPTGEGLRHARFDWSAGELAEPAPTAAVPLAPPGWITRHVPAPERPSEPLSPSDLGGAKALPGEGGQDEEAALHHGAVVHKLLEILPGHPPRERGEIAQNLFPGFDVSAALKEAEAVLNAAELAHVFAPGTLAEVELAARPDSLGGRRILGAIDRLIVGPERILAVDFKTNAVVPATPEETPEGLLRQMGAYLSGLRQVFPSHAIEIAILWTRTGQLMHLPPDILTEALHRVPHLDDAPGGT